VIGKSTAKKILEETHLPIPAVKQWDDSQVEDADELVVVSHNWDELRSLMWNYVGIVRTTRRLERALHRIEFLDSEVDEYYANFKVNRDLIELRNLLVCAELIVRSALARKESRGLHYSRDYPDTFAVSYPTILTPLRKKDTMKVLEEK
jgi:L-aspartate oxidase